MPKKIRAPRNRTTSLSPEDRSILGARILSKSQIDSSDFPVNVTINGAMLDIVRLLPDASVNLLILDPPYNRTKQFHSSRFVTRELDDYIEWFRGWFPCLLRILKPTASVYICSEWATSPAVQAVASDHLTVRNRITWEREKGRAASMNWKNCSEDIWFCTKGSQYTFNADAVKLRRRVVAPYRANGNAKDWTSDAGGPFRLTAASNLWTDITVPFWSMPENTDHPTQKPEKLIAKLVLASSREGDIVLDPFLGSGTTSVVCQKLGRRYIGIEIEREYCLLTEKRLAAAQFRGGIQGYEDGVFLERNTLALQMRQRSRYAQSALFTHET